MATVTLTPHEIQTAASVAVRRCVYAIAKGQRHRYNHPTPDLQDWAANIEGAAGELAVAKGLGRYFPGTRGGDSDGDLGYGVQVRHTCHADGHLIVYKTDKPTHLFFLARGKAPTFDLPGAVWGHEAQEEGWWNEAAREPSFWVPASALMPFEEFTAWPLIEPPDTWANPYDYPAP